VDKEKVKHVVRLFILIGICIIISIGLTYIAVIAGMAGYFTIIPVLNTESILLRFLGIIISTLISLGIILLLYMFLLVKGPFAFKFAISLGITPIVTVSVIFFGETFLLILFPATINPILYILVAFASLYIAGFSSVFIITDMLSEEGKKKLMLLYGSIMGAFIGVTMHTLSIFSLVIMISLLDTLLASLGFSERFLRVLETYPRRGTADFSYSIGSVDIGFGDFIFYSLIPAHAFWKFGLSTMLFSVFCLFIGVALTYRLIFMGKILPGIPIPISLSLIPIIVAVILSGGFFYV